MTRYLIKKDRKDFKLSVDELTKHIFDRYIPEFWSRAGTNEQLIRSFSHELSRMTDDISELNTQSFIFTATGIHLDAFGKLFRLSRLPGETDDDYRNRILNYYKLYSNSGALDNMKKILSSEFNIFEDDITITPVIKFRNTNMLATMEPGEGWSGPAGEATASNNVFYKGTQSIKVTATSANNFQANLVVDLNLVNLFNKNIDTFSLWYYFDDVTKIDKIQFGLADLGNPMSICEIEFDGTEPQFGHLLFHKKDFSNLSTTDFSGIKRIAIWTWTKSATVMYYDWIQQGIYSDSMMFDINISNHIIDPMQEIMIRQKIDNIKPSGSLLRNFTTI